MLNFLLPCQFYFTWYQLQSYICQFASYRMLTEHCYHLCPNRGLGLLALVTLCCQVPGVQGLGKVDDGLHVIHVIVILL